MTSSLRIRVAAGDELAAEFARDVRALATASFAARGFFALAVPGGSAAEVLLPALARELLPWERIHIFWCDERDVAADDPASNAGLLHRLWLGSAAWSTARLHPMAGGTSDLRAAARLYAEELQNLLGNPPRFDLVLLGVGEDGHIASLFPGHVAPGETDRTVLAILDAPKPPAGRLTLTLPVLAAAQRVVVAAFGSSKAAAIRDAVENRASQTPAALLLRRARDVTLLLDAEAASRPQPADSPSVR